MSENAMTKKPHRYSMNELHFPMREWHLLAPKLAGLVPQWLRKLGSSRLKFGSHALIVVMSLLLAYALRFDFVIPQEEFHRLWVGEVIALSTKMLVVYLLGTYVVWWRFAGIADLLDILAANFTGSVLFTTVTTAVAGRNFPRSIFLVDFLLCFLASAGARFAVRLYHESLVNSVSATQGNQGLLIYGAGIAGLNLVREIRSNPSLHYRIVGFLDDDAQKQGATLLGVQVLGRGRNAAQIVQRHKNTTQPIDQVVIAMPTASARQVSEALANARATGVPCKSIPGLGELIAGKVKVSQIREIAVENLLGRPPVYLEHDRIRKSVSGCSVLVTGAGGSIGSELCRQLAQFSPSCLVALDQAESELFKIEMEMKERGEAVPFRPVIGDIRNYARIEEILRKYKVTSIYHAAAYKHVPMMEDSLIEAVSNNVFGLYNMVQASVQNGVKSFVMISTDKAVNPTNIMGLTKRVAELVVSSMPTTGNVPCTRFVSVRFGNVLDSNGSVVPIFKAQIAAGGPVTVTHPEMRRYFMTIPEAVQLVLQASTMGQGGETFVLDMGAPVRILDLAKNMIRLSGHEPDVDIPIRFVGLRPGEKLFEELSTSSDQVLPTRHEKIMIFCGPTLEHETMRRWLAELRSASLQRNQCAVLSRMMDIVPEYQPSHRWRTFLTANTTTKPSAVNGNELKAAASA
jgi:FlaA1/EpsC-like NDP-sugar epimerase